MAAIGFATKAMGGSVEIIRSKGDGFHVEHVNLGFSNVSRRYGINKLPTRTRPFVCRDQLLVSDFIPKPLNVAYMGEGS